MGINMNPEGGKPVPDNTEVTYHKRGENEGISKKEFIHRLSVFLKEHSIEVENEFSFNGNQRGYGSSSVFSTPVSDGMLAHADDYFNDIDTDNSGTISLEELNRYAKNEESLGRFVAKFAKDAYNVDIVPDNPRNVLAKEKIDSTEFGL